MTLNKEENGYMLSNEKSEPPNSFTLTLIVLLHFNVNNQNNLCYIGSRFPKNIVK